MKNQNYRDWIATGNSLVKDAISNIKR